MGRRPPRLVGSLVAASVLAVAAAGCGGGSSAPAARERRLELSAGAPSKASRPTVAVRGPLAPGTYFTPTLKPTLTFQVDDGWSIDFEDRSALGLAYGSAGADAPGVTIMDLRRTSVIDPPVVEELVSNADWEKRARPYPADVFGYLRSVPYLDVGPEAPVVIDGRPGKAADVVLAHLPDSPGTCFGDPGPCYSPYAFLDDGVIFLESRGAAARVAVVKGPTGPLMIIEAAPDSATLAQARTAADALVASFRFA